MSNPQPIEFILDDVKMDIIKHINQLAEKYQLPGILMSLVLEQIIDESKTASLTNYINTMTSVKTMEDSEKDIPEIHVNAEDFTRSVGISDPGDVNDI